MPHRPDDGYRGVNFAGNFRARAASNNQYRSLNRKYFVPEYYPATALETRALPGKVGTAGNTQPFDSRRAGLGMA